MTGSVNFLGPPGNLIGRSITEYMPFEEHELIRHQSERIFKTRKALEAEMIVTDLDG